MAQLGKTLKNNGRGNNMSEYSKIYSIINADEVCQYNASHMLKKYFYKKDVKFLDLGCGKGTLLSQINGFLESSVDYIGIDIESSPEVESRDVKSEHFVTFDGVNIPFPDNCFDVVFCKQVLEHVRNPDLLIAEVFRVMKKDAFFIGSVSYLEPYHSFSIFNFTPYGLVTICNDHGLDCVDLKPGIDGAAMITRSLIGRSIFPSSFWTLSPENEYIMANKSFSKKQKINRMLQVTGQIVFAFKK